MVRKLEIEGFKCIDKQSFDLKPLTILTGLNSTGKSTIIQAILLLSNFSNSRNEDLSELVARFNAFSDIRNKYTNAQSLSITLDGDSFLNMNRDTLNVKGEGLVYEEQLYFLPANRVGQEELALFNPRKKLGLNGDCILGYFEQHKDKALNGELVKFKEAGQTLKAQVNGWLAYILDLTVSLQTEKITSNTIKISFNSDGIDNLSPFNLGAGNSYLVKVLIASLMCQKENILLIENPEIHLHPKAQALLGEFFAWLASAGVQVIVETHSEHFINKVKYQVYKNELSADDAIIYYKPSIREDFIAMKISQKGKFIDSEGNSMMFPPGFFDSTLQELLAIG